MSASSAGGSTPGVPRGAGAPERRKQLEAACLLSVDDAGQTLLVAGGPIAIGHLRSGRAELLFLADVGALHARLSRRDSLRDGPGWAIEALSGERVEVDGMAVGAEGMRLSDGQRVRLGGNLELRYRLPDPSSESACLELLHGSECLGARTIVLLGEGKGGRVRLGATPQCHVRVPNLELEIGLVKRGERLLVTSSAALRCGAVEGSEHLLPFPPARRFDLTSGERRGSRPPFGLSLAPADSPPGADRPARTP